MDLPPALQVATGLIVAFSTAIAAALMLFKYGRRDDASAPMLEGLSNPAAPTREDRNP